MYRVLKKLCSLKSWKAAEWIIDMVKGNETLIYIPIQGPWNVSHHSNKQNAGDRVVRRCRLDRWHLVSSYAYSKSKTMSCCRVQFPYAPEVCSLGQLNTLLVIMCDDEIKHWVVFPTYKQPFYCLFFFIIYKAHSLLDTIPISCVLRHGQVGSANKFV